MPANEEETRYLELLQLELGATSAHQAVLDRAHELRRFEIENYWKRATYFWGFQLVSFGALALVAKDGRFQPPLVLVVAAIGAVTAFAGGLTARGSKFWQRNWERHVDLLEGRAEGRLMEIVFIEQEKPSFSVSRVNERLLDVLFVAWLCAFGTAVMALVFPVLINLPANVAPFIQIGSATLGLGASLYWIGRGTRSRIQDRAYDSLTLEKRDVK